MRSVGAEGLIGPTEEIKVDNKASEDDGIGKGGESCLDASLGVL